MIKQTTNEILQKAPRNSSIELLRFLFMFLIVLLHVYGHGMELDYQSIYSWGGTPLSAIHLALFCLGKLGVTGFMFISGYYGIKMNKSKWISLLSMLFFYMIIIAVANSILDGSIQLWSFFNLLHPFDGWWFMSCYVFICIIAPFIESGIQYISKQQFQLIVGGVLFYTYFAHFIGGGNEHNVSFLLSIYIIGRYFKIAPPTIVKYNNIIGLLCTAILIFFPILVSVFHLPWSLNHLFISNNNILVLAIAASLVICLESRYIHIPVVNYFASSVLAIYLITDSSLLQGRINKLLLPSVLNGYGMFYIILVCISCLVIDKVRVFLFKKLLNI